MKTNKTTYIVTFEHDENVNKNVIQNALEKMAKSFHAHKPILSVDINEVELANMN